MSVAVVLIWLLHFGSSEVHAGNMELCNKTSTANDVASGEGLGHRVAVVTGGDSGLGYAIAETLTKQGASVVIATHNLEKGQAAARNITTKVGGTVVAMLLDLSSFKSVRAFATRFLAEFQTLNYLINNAGIATLNNRTTEDRFEDDFEVDYLGHFLLTELLLPTLRKNRGFAPAKIINIASTGHYVACKWLGLTEDCLKDWTYLPPPINPNAQNTSTYGLTKFAMIQHAAELATLEAGNSVDVFSVAPGFVATSMTDKANFSQACQAFNTLAHQDLCPYTPEQGAAVVAATAFKATHAGGWYTRYTGCSEAQPVMMHGFTTAMRTELYKRSLDWVGLAPSSSSLLI